MPICIAGMHRSGTSMIARLLMTVGVDLGPNRTLMPPTPANPEGYWESLPFRALNDALLSVHGGTWHTPPELADGWEMHEPLAELRRHAASLPTQLGLNEPWAWKDPRNSLTLPFWSRIWPDVRTIICVRNPLDVANSLITRDQFGLTASLNLWLHYHIRALAAVRKKPYMVTHFNSYFLDPATEIRRLMEFLGIRSTENAIHEACTTIAVELRHSEVGSDDLERVQAPADVIRMYRTLCSEAGPIFVAAEKVIHPPPALLVTVLAIALSLEKKVQELDEETRNLRPKIDEQSRFS